jgi:hypothetical protein
MNLQEFVKSAGSRLSDLKSRNMTGVFKAGCSLTHGQMRHSHHSFSEHHVFRRNESPHVQLASFLTHVIREAQRLEPRFTGTCIIQYTLFDGVVVDTGTEIKQTFVSGPG